MPDQYVTTRHVAPYQADLDGSGTFFVEEAALIELLADDVLLMSGGYPNGKKCTLVVNCSDLFYWATADGEELPPDEVEQLYRAWKADPVYGPSIWCCRQRGLRPQAPIEQKWRAQGVWTDELEALPKPEPS